MAKCSPPGIEDQSGGETSDPRRNAGRRATYTSGTSRRLRGYRLSFASLQTRHSSHYWHPTLTGRGSQTAGPLLTLDAASSSEILAPIRRDLDATLRLAEVTDRLEVIDEPRKMPMDPQFLFTCWPQTPMARQALHRNRGGRALLLIRQERSRRDRFGCAARGLLDSPALLKHAEPHDHKRQADPAGCRPRTGRR